MSRSIHAAQGASLPYNHHLHQFLTFPKHERGFADAAIVNRECSLKPFLGWLFAEDVPLSTVSPVVITNDFTGIVAARGSGPPSRFMYSLCACFFAMPAVEAGARRASPSPSTHPGATRTKIGRKGRREEVKKLFASVNGTSPVQIRPPGYGNNASASETIIWICLAFSILSADLVLQMPATVAVPLNGSTALAGYS